MADQGLIRRWLIQLGQVCSVRADEERASAFLDAFTPLLAMRFDDVAFTLESLEHVAAQCKYLPTYGELVPLLSAWRREHLENNRIAIECAGRGPARAREYKLPPPPDWAMRTGPRPLSELIRPPVRTVEEQLAELGYPNAKPRELEPT